MHVWGLFFNQKKEKKGLDTISAAQEIFFRVIIKKFKLYKNLIKGNFIY